MKRKNVLAIIIILSTVAAAAAFAWYGVRQNQKSEDVLLPKSETTSDKSSPLKTNPLENRSLYVDKGSAVAKTVVQKKQDGATTDAELLTKISSQPSAIWLVGPSSNDPDAKRDIEEVKRTSSEAAGQKALPVYQLYAVPNRDACAGYSKNGFQNNQSYIAWLNKVLKTLKSEAVFVIEADALAHIVQGNCLSKEQTQQRYELLREVTLRLSQDRKVLAAYIDVGHSEWFSEPGILVEPLRNAGVEHIRGVAVNVSFFVPTPEISSWSQQLMAKLGGKKGVIIDTSRNGRGTPPSEVRGEARWCNPKGRGLGLNPTTKTSVEGIDAYLWIKRPGESDGQCFNNPPAGEFSPAIAIELAKNAENRQ